MSGITAMMSVAEGSFQTPWRQTGFTFPETPPTAEEAMKLAGQDWEVTESGLYRPTTGDDAESSPVKLVPGWKALARSDNDELLGIVKDSYKVTQNKLLYDFEAALADDSGLRYETAGVLAGGKTVWAQAQVPKHIRIKGDSSDIIPYLIAWTGHDGGRGFGVGATTVRVRCQNTFHAATTQKDMPRFTLRHTAKVEDRIGEARKALQMSFAYLDTVEAMFNGMAAKPMSAKDFDKFVEKLLPVDPKAVNPWKTLRDREALSTLYIADTETMDGLKFTNYRALMAVTEFVDHHRTYIDTTKNGGNTAADNRALSLLDGQGSRMKTQALALLAN